MFRSSERRGTARGTSGFSRRKSPVADVPRNEQAIRAAIENLEIRVLMTTVTYVVTGHGDGAGIVTPTGANTYTATTLRAAIESSDAQSFNSVIQFNAANFPGGASNVISLTGNLVVANASHTTTLVGPTAHAVVINGGGQYTDLTAGTGVSLEVDNLTLENGVATSAGYGSDTAFEGDMAGGGIAAYGPLVIKNDSFVDNSAAGGAGGGVYSQTGVITAVNDTFTGNSAEYGGGVLTYDSSTNEAPSFSGGSFNQNTATDGGAAIFNQSAFNSTFTAANVSFTGNSSPELGAVASASLNGTLTNTLTNDTFTSNVGGAQGGAVFSGSITFGANNTTLNVTGGTFKSNVASAAEGAAIYSDDQSVSLNGVTFTGNNASEGAGLYVDGQIVKSVSIINSSFSNSQGTPVYDLGTADTLTVSGSSFTSNTGPLGGGIYAGGKSLSVSSTTFTGDQSTAGSNGGAIDYVGAGAATLSLTGDNFSSDSATSGSGGAIYAKAAALTVSNSTFTGDTAGSGDGGAIYDLGKNNEVATFTNDSFANDNAASGNGGSYYNDGGLNTNITFTGGSESNDQAEAGGAIFSTGNTNSTLTITGVTFAGNTANTQSGGAVYSGDVSLFLSGDAFSNNSALNSDGGAVFAAGNAAGGALTVAGSTFSGDLANGNGGGIAFEDNATTATITGTTFTGEQATASSDGGALYASAQELDLTTDTFANNTASSLGGAVLDSVSDATNINSSTFSNNTAQDGGGAISASDFGTGTLSVFNSTFNGNTTAYFGGGGVNSSVTTTVFANDTFYGNTAGSDVGGGGIAFTNGAATDTITDSTFDANSAGFGLGGGISNTSGDNVTLNGDIVAANDASGASAGNDLAGTFTGSYNLIGDGSNENGIVDLQNGNRVGTPSNPIDPMLGALANNGGPTLTQVPQPGSLAIGNGAPFTVLDQNSNDVTAVDQRGASRPGSQGYDIGAVQTDATAPVTTPTVTIGNASISKPTSGTATMNFTVSLSAPAPAGGVVVHYRTIAGTASSQYNDYIGTPGANITIPQGATTGTISITVKGNTESYSSKMFTVDILSVTNATLGNPYMGTGTIYGNSVATVPAASINNASVTPASSGLTPITFTVTLTAPAGASGVTIQYGTLQGTASSGAGDYIGVPSATLTIAAGHSTGTITIMVKPHTGPSKYFYVMLSNPVNATISHATGTGTIN